MSEFDQNLYDRLTADLEISEIKFSDAKSMTGESRWDSDYYQKHFLKNQKILEGKNSIRFWEMCYSIKKGIFDLSPENYIEAGIPFIRTTEIKEPTIRFSSTVFLDEKFALLTVVPGYLTPKDLSPILKYFGKDFHLKMKWDEFIKTNSEK